MAEHPPGPGATEHRAGTGSPGIHATVWRLAWPMILSNASVPLLGLVDTAILGHLDSPRYLAGVAVGASALSFLYWGFGFLRMGTTGLTAQSAGRGADPSVVLARGVLIALLLAGLLVTLRDSLPQAGLGLMAPAGEVRELAASYCSIRLLSAPAALLNYVLIGWFIGRRDTRLPLLMLVSSNVLNIVLDWLFIVGLGMQSDGAAAATVLADYAGLAIGAIAAVRAAAPALRALAPRRVLDPRRMADMLRINGHLFLRTVLLLFAFAFFTAQGARLGETVVSANAILMNLLMLTAFALDGFALAAEALTGEAIGARCMEDFRGTVRACARWSIATAAGFTVLFAALYPVMGQLFSASADVITLVRSHYGWLVALPAIAVWSYLLDGVFIGAMQTRAMRDTMLLSVVLVYLPVWYSTRGWGNDGLWFAFTLFSLARGLSLGWLYRRYGRSNRWLRTPAAPP